MKEFDFVREVLDKKITRAIVPVRLDEKVLGEDGLSVADAVFHIRKLEGELLLDVANLYNRHGLTSELAATILADCYFQGERFGDPIGRRYARWFVQRQPVVAGNLALKIIELSETDDSVARAVEDEVKNSETIRSS